jgi:hypothetical protein
VTDGLDQALVDAGLTLLRADTSLTVYDGAVPAGGVPPYVVVYATVSRPAHHPDNDLRGGSTRYLTTWYCHSVGGNAGAARAAAQRVRTALLDVKPTVVGLSCAPIREAQEPTPPDRDESTGTVVMDSISVYQMYAC